MSITPQLMFLGYIIKCNHITDANGDGNEYNNFADQILTDGTIIAKIENYDENVEKDELIKITHEVTVTKHSKVNLKEKKLWFKLNNPIPRLPEKFKVKYKNDSPGDISIVSHAILGESGENRRFKGIASQFNKGVAKRVNIYLFTH